MIVSAPRLGPHTAGSAHKLNWLLVGCLDRVVAGQVLARLDVADLQVQLEQSQATLSQQEANEAKVANGATPEQLAAADAQVQSAAITLDGARQSLQAAHERPPTPGGQRRRFAPLTERLPEPRAARHQR